MIVDILNSNMDSSCCKYLSSLVLVKSYKFRIYPNREQTQTLTQTIETCRMLYNDSLEQRRKDRGLLSYYDQKKQLTQIKHNDNDDAIKHNIHSQVLQNVILLR